jgi:hypothetical protein
MLPESPHRVHAGLIEGQSLCFFCNHHKGPNIAGIDPESKEITHLLHPRRDNWNEHMQVHEGELRGLTSIGRTTIQLLRMNERDRIEIRKRSERMSS